MFDLIVIWILIERLPTLHPSSILILPLYTQYCCAVLSILSPVATVAWLCMTWRALVTLSASPEKITMRYSTRHTDNFITICRGGGSSTAFMFSHLRKMEQGIRRYAMIILDTWYWITILKPFLNVKWWSRLSVYPGGFVNLATITVSTWSKLIWVSTLY